LRMSIWKDGLRWCAIGRTRGTKPRPHDLLSPDLAAIRFRASVSTSRYQIDPATSTISVPTQAGKHQTSIASNELSARFPRVPL
jgi:hypothetical protein